ncbi:MAG: chemotaxis protein CheB [Deltaproteobacteria bacterium]|nr:chemotaxis protein CheB [Deltaproteobacteria bacterium]
MIRILIAEDSTTVQRVLTTLLDNEKNLEIVGIASDGEQAVEMCCALKPDLVTMDIFMPKKNGLEATKEIMSRCPTPIVIISSMVKSGGSNLTFEAMRAGAIEVIEKPTGILSNKYQDIKKSLISIIERSAHTNPDALFSWLPSSPIENESKKQEERESTGKIILQHFSKNKLSTLMPDIICIGGSTGAPTVIVEILSKLPKDYPIPVIVAQHISKGFAPRMADWLNSSIELNVKMAEENITPSVGTVLICPDDQHLKFSPERKIKFEQPTGTGMHIPSIDMLFSTASIAYEERAVGIILSGMGKDGADGILEMKNSNALTIAQNSETSVIFGMNKIAIDFGAIDFTLSPTEIAEALLTIGSNFHK